LNSRPSAGLIEPAVHRPTRDQADDPWRLS
jgi:hypothetical protein